MSRYARNSVVLLKKETTAGTDAVPTGAANAVLVSNLKANPLNAQNVSRDLVRDYFGGSEQLVGSAYKTIDFDVEFQNGGTAGELAPWDAALQCCGFASGSLLTVPSRVEHNIAAPGAQASATIYYYDDGALHKLLYAKGTVSLDLSIGSRPVFQFKFIGLDGGLTAAANPAATLTGYKTPLVVTDPNTGALTLGCTYATGALSGGTEYVSGGLTLDLGNAVNFTDLLGTATQPGQTVEITQRETTGKLMLDLTAANEATFMANVKSNTLQSVGLVHGVTAGLKMMIFLPAVQLINPTLEEKDGRRLIGYDFRALPVAGNDEFKLIAL
jgi:hypothetical protein